MSDTYLVVLIIGMMAVTVFSRLAPTLLAEKRQPGPELTLWLDQVPAAVMAAIVLPALVTKDGHLDLSFGHIELWVGLCTIVAALIWKNFYLTIFAGLAIIVTVSLVT